MNVTPLVVMALVICTSIWVAIDSKSNRIPSGNRPYSFMNGAFVWFSFCILFWIITFPYYLVRRSKLLAQRRQDAVQPPVPATLAVAPLKSADMEEELRTLARLKQDGIITEEEFDQKKKRVLGLAQVALAAHASMPAAASTSATKAKQRIDPVRATVAALGVLVMLLVGIALLVAGTVSRDNDKTPTHAASTPADPSIRYIGDNGAVAGSDNYGRTTRLAPGTQVRLTNGTWMGNPAGPQKVYVVAQGELAGMQVPLSEADLRPQ